MTNTSAFRIIAVSTCFALLCSCATFPKHKLAEPNPPPQPGTRASLEWTFGKVLLESGMSVGGGASVSDAQFNPVRLFVNAFIERWYKKGYISAVSEAPLGEFTGNADYEMTVNVHSRNNASIANYLLTAVTLTLFPFIQTIEFTATLDLKERATGRVYKVRAEDGWTDVQGLLMLPMSPFYMSNLKRIATTLADYSYGQFRAQGAFQPLPSAAPQGAPAQEDAP